MSTAPTTATRLIANGASLIFAGFLCGAAIPHVPYPRLMLAAHSAGFMSSGILSILAGVLVRLSYTAVSQRGSRIMILGHVLLWPLSLSVAACHILPATALMAAWAVVLWGMRQGASPEVTESALIGGAA